MPIKKITDLTDIGTPASDDLLEIVDVSDTTDSPQGTSKKVLVSALGGGGGVTEFIELTDVPASYTGQGSKVVAVKADETGLEFVAGGGGSSPFVQETNGAIHRADLSDFVGGENSTNLTTQEGSASGDLSHADSQGIATGFASHSDSQGISYNLGAHADSGGFAHGQYSHAQANGTANGNGGSASGINVVSNSYSQMSVGLNNEDITANNATGFHSQDLVFDIGIGQNPSNLLTSFSAYKNGGFKFISRLLSNITNTAKGFFAYDENGRPNSHDGTQWNPLAYLSEVGGGAVDSVNGQTGVVVLDSDDISEGATNLYFTDTRALGAIPDATPTVKGIAKLYTSLGTGTDGSVDRSTITAEINKIKSKYLFANGASLTGVTTEAVIQTLLIPANTYDSIDGFLLNVPLVKSTTSASINYRLYHGTSSGATTTQIGLLALSNVNRMNTIGRYYSIDGGFLNSASAFTANFNVPYASSNIVNTPIAFDHTVNNWITVTANPSVTTEVIEVLNMSITPLKY